MFCFQVEVYIDDEAKLTLQGVAAPCHLLVCSIQGSHTFCRPPYQDQACPSCSTPGTPTCYTCTCSSPALSVHTQRSSMKTSRPMPFPIIVLFRQSLLWRRVGSLLSSWSAATFCLCTSGTF